MTTINAGDRVTWQHRWYGYPDEQMVGTVLEIVDSRYGRSAWISVVNDQSPLYVRLDRLTPAPRAIEVAVDDYAYAVGLAGDLGGAELS